MLSLCHQWDGIEMGPSTFTYELADGIMLKLSSREVDGLVGSLRAAGLVPPVTVVGQSSDRILTEDSPFWDRHDGGDANHASPPEWDDPRDLELAVTTYRRLRNKVLVFADLLIDHPGQLLSVDEICAAAPTVFQSDRSIAGSLNGFLKPCRDVDRRFPFYWWEHRPTDYAMRPSVARLFAAARAEVLD